MASQRERIPGVPEKYGPQVVGGVALLYCAARFNWPRKQGQQRNAGTDRNSQREAGATPATSAKFTVNPSTKK